MTAPDPGEYAEALITAIEASSATKAEKAHLQRMTVNLLRSISASLENVLHRIGNRSS